MRIIILLAYCLLSSLSLFAQKGKIEGKVINSKNGQPLTGVTVLIKNTNKGGATDTDGHYVIVVEGLSKVSLVYSYGGTEQEVNDIEVTDGKVTTQDLSFEPRAKTGDEVVVRASSSAKKETVNAMIAVQKNTAVVAQVISAETIKRSPDKSTGEILKRVPGTSVQEGKYLVVRGLSDRYNQAMLNGILLSSTEPDRKTFSFDIFPAGMIDNIVMNKTFIPELPGEWAGGLVQVQTKDVPAAGFLNIQVGTGFNSNTIGRDFLQGKGGKLDWLGIDDGYRALPKNLPLKTAFSQLNAQEKSAYGAQFKNDWMPEKTNAPLNAAFQLNGGGNTKLLGKKVAGIFAITYNQSNKKTPFNNIFVTSNNGDFDFTYQNNKYSRDVLAGALANLAVQLNSNNKISFKNIINVNSTDFVVDRYDGRDKLLSGGNNGDRVKATEIGFKQNIFFNTQLIGDHHIKKLDAKFRWYGSFNILDQYIPNQRRLFYTQAEDDPGGPYRALIGTGSSQKSGSIFYSTLSDYNYNAGADFTKSILVNGKQQAIKAGYLFQVKDRLFNSRPFFNGTASDALRLLPQDKIFAPENFGTGNDKVQFNEIPGESYRYMANSILNAGYLQFDNTLSEKVRIVWGARMEVFDQLVGSVKQKDPRHAHTIVKDVLPGFNLTYKLNSKTNIRIAGSQTVIRPEFRELSNFAFYDFELGSAIQGSKALNRTKVSNFDLRYELYPRAGELLTAGIFYKYFNTPLEYYLNNSSFNIINTKNARSLGAEIEVRKKLDFINSLKNFTVSGNISYVNSNVKDSTGNVNRPLQGQSPYLVNANLQYDHTKAGFTATLLFNQIGRRILFVGNEAIPNIWEAPRPLFDLQLAKKLLKTKGELKLNISDLLNKTAMFYHDIDNNKRYNSGSKDVLAITRNYGTTFSLSFSYSIK